MSTPTLSGFLRKASFWTHHAGVRWTLFLSLAAFWFLMSWLRNEYGQEDSTLWLVIRLFALLVQWMLIGLVVFSTASALAVWLHFRYLLKRKAASFDVHFGDGQKAEAGWVPIVISLQGQIFRPLLGTVQAQLVFADKQLSLPVVLDQNQTRSRQLWRSGIRGRGRTWLHDRGIHDVEHVLITFVDMLSLVSLPVTIDAVQQVYTLPRAQAPQRVVAQPHSTEEQKHRIDVPKRVEGEYVNYKEFETGDNIQRIVWKIYAKSGQLVVRIPEIKDPYASHLYFYVSYYNGLKREEGAFEKEMLNVYKDYVRSLFEALSRNGYEVRIPADQEVPHLAGVGEKKRELFQITAADWQQSNTPAAFVSPGKAAFVCLPSLVPASEVAALMKRLPEAVPMVVVKLSEAIPSPFRFTVKDIFFAPEPQPADKLSKPWLVSGLRRDLLRNEKELESLLRQRPQAWMTKTISFEQA
ncbi:MAG: DUF58 domain-containing protein [Cyclobacteriaceae bacterium]|nr:DUF58 domain-containing protein [Cyclobacteriaceae bacterium]